MLACRFRPPNSEITRQTQKQEYVPRLKGIEASDNSNEQAKLPCNSALIIYAVVCIAKSDSLLAQGNLRATQMFSGFVDEPVLAIQQNNAKFIVEIHSPTTVDLFECRTVRGLDLQAGKGEFQKRIRILTNEILSDEFVNGLQVQLVAAVEDLWIDHCQDVR